MSELPPDRPHVKKKRRHSFLEERPVQHVRTPEFRQIAGLALLLVMLVVFFFMFQNTTPRVLKKVFPERTADPPSSPDAIPITIAMAPAVGEQDAPPGAYHGAFINVIDGVDFAETTPWLQVMKQLRTTPSEEMAKNAGDRVIDFARVMENPAKYRGETMKVHGVVAGIGTIRVRDETQGLKEVWRAYVTDLGDHGAVIDLATEPPRGEDLLVQKDHVEIDAVFFRTVRYETQDGSTRLAPYLLARDLKVIRKPNSSWLSDAQIRTIALVGFTAIFAVVYIMSRRRLKKSVTMAPAGFKEMFDRKLREERAKRSDPAAGRPGDAGPGSSGSGADKNESSN